MSTPDLAQHGLAQHGLAHHGPARHTNILYMVILIAIAITSITSTPASVLADEMICEGQGNATLVMKGSTEIGARLKFKIGGAGRERYKLFTTFGSGPSELPGIGTFCLDFNNGRELVQAGRFGPVGVRAAYWTLPDDSELVGETVSFQAACTDPEAPNGVAITNAYSFPLAPEGSGGDVCTPCGDSGGACSCGISEIGFIAPVFLLEEIADPAEVLVRVVDGDNPQNIVDEVVFLWSATAPPALPLTSATGNLLISKVTHHADAVVVFATINVAGTDEGMLPAYTVIEAYVDSNELIRELDLSCQTPVRVGTKLRPLFIRSATAAECETDDCPVTLDFETEDDFATALENGQDIATPDEFGVLVDISTTGDNQGGACFDTTVDGPNAGGPDPDLLVDLGNVLMLQSNDDPEQTDPGYFDTPNDSARGGTIYFDFVHDSELFSIDLIDIDSGGQSAVVTLVDAAGRLRVYDVPSNWTGDVSQDDVQGYGTLDLTTLDPQPGFESTATATEDNGFDPAHVVELEVFFESSGATDNLVLCPKLQ